MVVSTLCSNKTKGCPGGRFTAGIRKSQTTRSKCSARANSSIKRRITGARLRAMMTGKSEKHSPDSPSPEIAATPGPPSAARYGPKRSSNIRKQWFQCLWPSVVQSNVMDLVASPQLTQAFARCGSGRPEWWDAGKPEFNQRIFMALTISTTLLSNDAAYAVVRETSKHVHDTRLKNKLLPAAPRSTRLAEIRGIRPPGCNAESECDSCPPCGPRGRQTPHSDIATKPKCRQER